MASRTRDLSRTYSTKQLGFVGGAAALGVGAIPAYIITRLIAAAVIGIGLFSVTKHYEHKGAQAERDRLRGVYLDAVKTAKKEYQDKADALTLALNAARDRHEKAAASMELRTAELDDAIAEAGQKAKGTAWTKRMVKELNR